jgi:hypothetical protein
MTAFCAAARQHSTAICRFHTDAEAVGLGPVAVIRLKSTFRHYGSSEKIREGRGELAETLLPAILKPKQ